MADRKGQDTAARADRREVLGTGARVAGAAAVLAAARAALPGGAWAAGGEGLEKNSLRLGFVPLTDCAPLAVALEKGYFARHGLDVALSREPSWANIRDKVSVGVLDGAQMISGMPLAATAGIGSLATPMRVAASLDLNGNAITLSEALYQRMRAADPEAMRERPLTARALKAVIAAERADGRAPLRFGVVFSVASHAYQLRYWLAAAGIDPDTDVAVVVVPPPRMVASLKAGEIDGFCVGDPWNTLAVHEGIGRIAITSYELWNNAPEKLFGVTAAWADRNPATLTAVVRALIEAARWLDDPGNRAETAAILARPAYLGVPAEVVIHSLAGRAMGGAGEEPRAVPDFHVFHRHAATFPWRSHALWTLSQMVRWGQLPESADLAGLATEVFRPDVHRAAAAQLGEPVPTVDHKTEGTRHAAWTLTDATAPIAMGPDRFFDGGTFDPADPLGYARGFAIRTNKPHGREEAAIGA